MRILIPTTLSPICILHPFIETIKLNLGEVCRHFIFQCLPFLICLSDVRFIIQILAHEEERCSIWPSSQGLPDLWKIRISCWEDWSWRLPSMVIYLYSIQEKRRCESLLLFYMQTSNYKIAFILVLSKGTIWCLWKWIRLQCANI